MTLYIINPKIIFKTKIICLYIIWANSSCACELQNIIHKICVDLAIKLLIYFNSIINQDFGVDIIG